MGSYIFKTLEERRNIQRLYESGYTRAELAAEFGTTLASMRRELLRGFEDEIRLPDMRLRYDAELAQLRMQRSLERRGKPRRKQI